MKTQEQKIEYLRKLLSKLLIFSRRYNSVELKISGKDMMVLWFNPKDITWYSFEQLEFPVSDLDIRIEHYKNKLKYAFKTRNRVKA